MENVKLRAKFAKSLGVKFAADDEFLYKDGDTNQLKSSHTLYNDNEIYCDDLSVASFAPRKNTGDQPCGDDVPVVCDLLSGNQYKKSAAECSWELENHPGDVLSWKPCIESLIKLQIEHDRKLTLTDSIKKMTDEIVAKSNKAITKALADINTTKKDTVDAKNSAAKGRTVVDAVNYFHVDKWMGENPQLIYKAVIEGFFDSEKVKTGCEFVCTINEFNQCVKELSEAAWMNDGEPMFYDIYKIAYRDMANAETVAKSNKAVEWENGEECAVNGVAEVARYIGLADNKSKCWISFHPCAAVKVPVSMLSRPETPQQKAAREREEKAKALFDLFLKCSKKSGFDNEYTYSTVWGECAESYREMYRKVIDAGVNLS